jgi:hypothetical protein
MRPSAARPFTQYTKPYEGINGSGGRGVGDAGPPGQVVNTRHLFSVA